MAGGQAGTAAPITEPSGRRGVSDRAGAVGPIVGPSGRPEPPTAFDLTSVVLRYRREVLALTLLGPGGVLLPFPLWLVGAAIGLTCWAWSRAEKLIGLAGPVIVSAAGIGVIGALNKNPSIPVDLHAYVAAAQAHGSLLMRLCSAAGAIFLGARLVRSYRAGAARSANR